MRVQDVARRCGAVSGWPALWGSRCLWEAVGGVDGDERPQDAANGDEQGGAGRDDRLNPASAEPSAGARASSAGERSSGARPQRTAGGRPGRSRREEDAELRGRVATAAFTGARVREVLAIRWCDIDPERKLIHLRGQINVTGTEIVPMKTVESERYVALVPKLEPYLGREGRMAARWSADDDFVFSAGGTDRRTTATSGGRSRSPPKTRDSAKCARMTYGTRSSRTCSHTATSPPSRGPQATPTRTSPRSSTATPRLARRAGSTGRARRLRRRSRLLMLCKRLRRPNDIAMRKRKAMPCRLSRMERTGIEPVTFGLQSRRSPS